MRKLAVILLLAAGVASAQARKPNIVYIMSDELAYYELSHMGNPYIKTPNIDRHILVNLRDVLAEKNDNLDCSSCHSVHAASNKKHESLDNRDFCYTCHVRGKPKSRVRRFSRGSDTCEVKGIDP